MQPKRENDLTSEAVDLSSSDSLREIDGTRGLVDEFARGVLSRFEGVEALAVGRAFKLALELHSGQERADGSPYIGHLTSVASRILLDFGINDATAVSVGLLHDAVEDHSAKIAARVSPNEDFTKRESHRVALEYLGQEFGSEVATAVRLVTNPIDLFRDARKISKQEGLPLPEVKNKLYVKHVCASTDSNEIALVVKLSDFFDNFGSLANIKDVDRRAGLAAKYEPLRQHFETRLNAMSDDSIFGEQRASIMRQLASFS